VVVAFVFAFFHILFRLEIIYLIISFRSIFSR